MEELMRIIASLEFASPLYFWAGGAVILFWIFFPILRKKRLLRFDLGYWEKKVRLKSKKTRIIPVLIVIIAVLIAAALANPQIIEKRNILQTYFIFECKLCFQLFYLGDNRRCR